MSSKSPEADILIKTARGCDAISSTSVVCRSIYTISAWLELQKPLHTCIWGRASATRSIPQSPPSKPQAGVSQVLSQYRSPSHESVQPWWSLLQEAEWSITCIRYCRGYSEALWSPLICSYHADWQRSCRIRYIKKNFENKFSNLDICTDAVTAVVVALRFIAWRVAIPVVDPVVRATIGTRGYWPCKVHLLTFGTSIEILRPHRCAKAHIVVQVNKIFRKACRSWSL